MIKLYKDLFFASAERYTTANPVLNIVNNVEVLVLFYETKKGELALPRTVFPSLLKSRV